MLIILLGVQNYLNEYTFISFNIVHAKIIFVSSFSLISDVLVIHTNTRTNRRESIIFKRKVQEKCKGYKLLLIYFIKNHSSDLNKNTLLNFH